MSLYSVRWNSVSHVGVFVSDTIRHNLDELKYLCTSLESYNCYLVAIHNDGILIKESFIESDFSYLQSQVAIQREKLIVLEGNINSMSNLIDRLEPKVKALEISEFSTEKEEVSEEFYIMYDYLPAHIKKEIKIFKK